MDQKHEKSSREVVVELLNLLYPEGEGDERLFFVAKTLGLDKETARQARSRVHRKGSVETYTSLILSGLDLNPSDLKQYFPKIRKLLETPEKLAAIEQLFEEVRTKFGDNEVIAWLRLLLAHHEIEVEMGLRKKTPFP